MVEVGQSHTAAHTHTYLKFWAEAEIYKEGMAPGYT